MKKPVLEYQYKGRSFECIVYPVLSGHYEWLEVSISEIVHPNWKIFRTRYMESKTFFTEDFATINEGVKTMLAKVIRTEEEQAQAKKNFKEFAKRA